MNEALTLSLPATLGAAGLILLNGGLSLWLRLGLEKRLLVASLRTVVQLMLLGYILVPVFRAGHPALVAAVCALMVGLAAREAVARLKRRADGVMWVSGLSLLVGATASAVFGAAVLVHADPWWMPRVVIPLVGMVLGNTLTGLALGLDRVFEGLDAGRAAVELRLARGATSWEAARPVAKEAVRTGMVPILNAMSAVGLVTIPGMMTGQLLAGAAPEQAARYQIVIMFLIAAGVGLGTVTAVLLTVRSLFDSEHRLRYERIRVVAKR